MKITTNVKEGLFTAGKNKLLSWMKENIIILGYMI